MIALNCPPDEVVIKVWVSLTDSLIVSLSTPKPPEVNIPEIV